MGWAREACVGGIAGRALHEEEIAAKENGWGAIGREGRGRDGAGRVGGMRL